MQSEKRRGKVQLISHNFSVVEMSTERVLTSRWCLAGGGLSPRQLTPWRHSPLQDFPGQDSNFGLKLAPVV